MMATSDSSFSAGDDELDERSFARPALSPRSATLAALGIVALIAIASWIGWGQASQPVRWQDVGFDISSPSRAVAIYDVYLYTDLPVTCSVKALSENFAEVGIATQSVDPALGREQRFSTSVTTVQEATTAVVAYCDVDPTT
jgi:hypothetical protein